MDETIFPSQECFKISELTISYDVLMNGTFKTTIFFQAETKVYLPHCFSNPLIYENLLTISTLGCIQDLIRIINQLSNHCSIGQLRSDL